jgi:hypothetical protein
MSHPIVELQTMLVAALRAEDLLVFDSPPSGATPPYLAVARHDVVPRDGDEAPGHEHRVAIHCWAKEPSRKAALALAEQVLAVGQGPMAGPLAVTHAVHERTETAVDGETGFARAAVVLRFFTEPV